MVTLQQLLESRDARHAKQVQLLSDNPSKTLLVLTVIMPGSDKRNALSQTIAAAAVEALRKTFGTFAPLETYDLETGYEAYLLTALPEDLAKRRATAIEDTHPLGRLFDIDVIQRTTMMPLSREQVGRPPRRCLLCEREARYCMRERAHKPAQLLAKIQQIVADYARTNIKEVYTAAATTPTTSPHQPATKQQPTQRPAQQAIAPEACDIVTLPLSIAHNRDRIDAFLADNGLRYDDLDAYTAVVAPDGTIVAGAGISGDVIKCVAVSEAGRGGGWAAKLVSELISEAASQGITNVKVFTKPSNRDIFEGLGFKVIGQAPEAIAMEHDPSALRSFRTYLSSLSRAAGTARRRGIIIMNANPMTRGHLYLLQEAAKQVDHLFVMVVSEDRSTFTTAEREAIVRDALRGMNKVTVCTTRHYAVSATTFPTYFLKDLTHATDTQIRLDLDIFCRIIAPGLGITTRFVGSEPTDALTARYNALMHDLLPEHDIKVCEVPRLTAQGHAISASNVRAHLSAGHWADALLLVVPEAVPYLLALAATNALTAELDTTPKPGLVDKHDAGAHQDMDYRLMAASIAALRPQFAAIAQMGLCDTLPTHAAIIAAGLTAEKAMLSATHGINTHKGAIFCMGLWLIAAAHLVHKRQAITATALSDTIRLLAADFPNRGGAIAMAQSGYATLFDQWLPALRRDRSPHRLLMRIIAVLDDTNVIRRAGYETAQRIKQEALTIAEKADIEGTLATLNDAYIGLNISPGGAADMLALTLLADHLLP